MKNIRHLFVLAALSLSIFSTAVAQNAPPEIPQDWAAFMGFHQEVLMKTCIRCHDRYRAGFSVKEDPVEMARFLVDSKKYVIPGALDQGKLLERLKGGGWFSSQMPPYGHYFNPDGRSDEDMARFAVQSVSAWIAAGARVPQPSN